MEFLKTIRKKSFLSEVVYAVLNIGLAIGVLLLIRSTGSFLPALLLILLSKWRVLAVRPRYWFANIQANLVDVTVSIGYVVALYTMNDTARSGESWLLQLVVTALYVGWLLFLKPQSKRRYVVLQAGVALFVGVATLFMVSYSWPVSLVVLFMWLIGYVVARHVLGQYEEDHYMFLSLLWGVFMAELGWLFYHWTIAYGVPGVGLLKIPQAAVITVCCGFLAYKIYQSQEKHGKVLMSDVILPLLFTLSIVVVLVLFFNKVSVGSL